jgi:hypothetical protein
MKRLKPDIAVERDPEQEWINKYRAAISEPPPQPIFEKILGRLGYLVGIILGKSKKLVTDRDSTPERTQSQPLEEIGIKSKKKKRGSSKQNHGKAAA